MKKVTAKYPDTEKSLYAIAGRVRRNLKADLARFAKQDKKYTKGFIEELSKRIEATVAMPGHVQRQATLRTLRRTVIQTSKKCCSDFMTLMRYVDEDAFAKENIAALRKAAGGKHYKRATEKNWLAMNTLNRTMKWFLNAYTEKLEMADMPEEFAARVMNHTDAFEKALKAFCVYKIMAEKETAEKLAANNELYCLLQEILKDGKRIFKKEAEKLQQYSYRSLLNEWKGKQKGVKKEVMDGGLPLVGAAGTVAGVISGEDRGLAMNR